MQKRNLPYRKSFRLKGWDYRSPGLYFVTICTKNRAHHFGEIRDDMMGLSVPGCVAYYYWRQIPHHQKNVVLDEFVVMPNHLHGIIGIKSEETCGDKKFVGFVGTLHATSPQNDKEAKDFMSNISPKAGSLSVIIRSYKSATTKWCNANSHEYFAWHSRFHDHIIRNEKALHRIRKYIHNNPLEWEQDQQNLYGNEIHEQAVEYMVGKK